MQIGVLLSSILFSIALVVSQEGENEGKRGKGMQDEVSTFPGVDGKIYITSRPAHYNPQSHPVYPVVFGIGGGKSGTTQMMVNLRTHPEVLVGNATLGNKTCCGPELYVLNALDLHVEGLNKYDRYFEKPNEKIKVLAEKTPSYSYDPLIPFNVKALIGDQAKLIYTIRAPVDQDISLYFHSKREDKKENKLIDDMTYLTWISSRIKIFELWDNCRQSNFQKSIVPDLQGKKDYISYSDMYTSNMVPVKDIQSVEGDLARACGRFPPGRTVLTSMNGYNIKRWVRLFPPPDSFICVSMETSICRPNEVMANLTAFLGLSPWHWDLKPPPPNEKSRIHADKEKYTSKRRLVAYYKEKGWDPSEIDEALQISSDFYDIYNDESYIRKYCPLYNEVTCDEEVVKEGRRE